MTPSKVEGHLTLKNPIGILIFYNLYRSAIQDYGYVDYRGMRIRTKVIPLMKRLNHADPVFEAIEDYLKTLLPRAYRPDSSR